MMSIYYVDQASPYIFGELIEEWDITKANISLMEYYKLAPASVIDKLRSIPKQLRNETVGKMILKNKEFGKNLEESFSNIVKEFIKSNQLDASDIIAIRKDAIFVRNRTIKVARFGPVEFVHKNKYHARILLPRYEFLCADNHTDVKGIADAVLPKHQDGMLAFIEEFVSESKSYIELQRFLKQYCVDYKSLNLFCDAYRQFDSESKFHVLIGSHLVEMDSISEAYLPKLNIEYNYINVVLEAIKLTI